jgi:hypothetical protein
MSATSLLRVHPTRSVRRTSGLVLVGNPYLGITSGLPVTRTATDKCDGVFQTTRLKYGYKQEGIDPRIPVPVAGVIFLTPTPISGPD